MRVLAQKVIRHPCGVFLLFDPSVYVENRVGEFLFICFFLGTCHRVMSLSITYLLCSFKL